MSDDFTTDGIHLSFDRAPNARPADNTPFRILVIGDFGGRGNEVTDTTTDDVANCRPIEINRDNFDKVMASLKIPAPVSRSDESDQGNTLTGIDDLHPDQLLNSCAELAALKRLRKQLFSSGGFEAAASEVRSWGLLANQEQPTEKPDNPPPETPEGDLGGLLDQAIAQSEKAAESDASGLPRELQELIRQSVEPIRIEKSDPARDDLVACVDAVATKALRQTLTTNAFRSLEASWRGLHRLTRQLRTGTDIKIFLLDISKAALADDLGKAGRLEATLINKVLVQQTVRTPGADPWGVVLVDYEMESTGVDILLAGCLARVAAHAGTSVIVGASSSFVGATSFTDQPRPSDWTDELPENAQQAWNAIRSMPEAKHLAFTMPRYLARLPYGPNASPIKSFPFDEVEVTPNQSPTSQLLWGNSVYLVGELIGAAFLSEGWKLDITRHREIADLPIYCFNDGVEELVHPTIEHSLSFDAAEQIANEGCMPWLAILNRDVAQLGSWRSIAADRSSLQGRWN